MSELDVIGETESEKEKTDEISNDLDEVQQPLNASTQSHDIIDISNVPSGVTAPTRSHDIIDISNVPSGVTAPTRSHDIINISDVPSVVISRADSLSNNEIDPTRYVRSLSSDKNIEDRYSKTEWLKRISLSQPRLYEMKPSFPKKLSILKQQDDSNNMQDLKKDVSMVTHGFLISKWNYNLKKDVSMVTHCPKWNY